LSFGGIKVEMQQTAYENNNLTAEEGKLHVFMYLLHWLGNSINAT
jgi:hypothetical protein